MDCFMEGPNFLVIKPDECIDCSICVPECPVAGTPQQAAAWSVQKRADMVSYISLAVTVSLVM